MSEADQERVLEAKVLAALARREYGYHELRAKFAAQCSADLVTKTLDAFVAKGWQSDTRYVEQVVRAAVGRGKGELWIRQKLRQQDIASTIIDQALAEYDFYALAQQVYTKKYPTATDNHKELAKRQRFLASRGFSFDHINEAIHHDE